jgi:hypothetical protein
MLAIFISLNKFIMKIDSIIYLMILLMYYKYYSLGSFLFVTD